jgi:short subunit dehydrogenase-like uncharacterized protein
VAGRIVLLGATGYTGRLTAEAMVERGLRPLLAARNQEKLDKLNAELGGDFETAVADVSDPGSVAALVTRGDVLVTTVGPFLRHGGPAAGAAATHGAHYLDSTGEPPFIRQVFERYGEAARASGSGMLTAFGYDFVPGNLAGALALERADERAVRVDVGYFATGASSPADLSGGTRASLLGVMTEPSFAYREGRVRTERGASRHRDFALHGKERGAVAIGASEHFGLPRVAPQLEEVNTYLGWFGPASRVLPVLSLASSGLMKLPLASKAWDFAASKLARGSTGGPGPEERAKVGSHVVGIAYDGAGEALAEVHVTGSDAYGFTGRILAWGAERAAQGGLRGTGALGPVDGFGLRELERGCAEAGLTAEDADGSADKRKPGREPAKPGASSG